MQEFITLGSIVAAILAWVAKIYWTKEQLQAKEEIIRSKEETIRNLEKHIAMIERLNPKVIKEWYDAAMDMSIAHVNKLEEQITELQKKEEPKPKEQDETVFYQGAPNINDLLSSVAKIKEKIGQHTLPSSETIATSGSLSQALAKIYATKTVVTPGDISKAVASLEMSPFNIVAGGRNSVAGNKAAVAGGRKTPETKHEG